MLENILEYLKIHLFENSYSRMIVAVIIIVLTILIRMIVVKLFNSYIHRSSAEVKNNPTNYTFLKHVISATIYVGGFTVAIYSVPIFRSLANSLLAGVGILAVALGFASQKAFSNIISGIFIIIFKPFRVNDRLQIKSDINGIVEDITLRHTVIRSYENKRVIIPNSIIGEETLINADIIDEKICKTLDLGIGYSADIEKARKIIQEEAMKHPFYIDNRDLSQLEEGVDSVIVRVLGWGDSSINLRAWIWANNYQSAYIMGCDLYERIKNRFDEEDIEIPFPYRTIIYKNDLNKENK